MKIKVGYKGKNFRNIFSTQASMAPVSLLLHYCISQHWMKVGVGSNIRRWRTRIYSEEDHRLINL